ncbi:MAG: PrsW family intramembrane metalloprotease [Candidatus Bipolaricaulia bacterium]
MGGIRVAVATVFTILPIALLLRFFFTLDLRREPRTTVAVTFLLGIVIALPAIFVSLVIAAIPGRSFGLFGGAAYGAFAVSAIPEELLKLLVIACYSARRRSFDEPMDGVVYGAAAALGFAAIENVLYVAQGGWIAAVMRSVTAVPMHAAAGAILGYHIARRRLLLRRHAVWTGLAIAVLLHGLYDLGPIVLARLGGDEAAYAAIGPVRLGCLGLSVAVLATALVGVRRLVLRLRAQQMVGSALEAVAAPPRAAEGEDPLVAHLLERRSGHAALPADRGAAEDRAATDSGSSRTGPTVP